MSEQNLDRVSVRFLVDNQPYNQGESAVFSHQVAAGLVARGLVKMNSHKVENDSNLMGLIKGDNDDLNPKAKGGLSESEVGKLIDEKLDAKLKPILDALNKGPSSNGPTPPLSPAIKK